MTYKIIQSGLMRRYHVYRNNYWIVSFRHYSDAKAYVDIHTRTPAMCSPAKKNRDAP